MMEILQIILLIIIFLIIIELSLYLLTDLLRTRFEFILTRKDEFPLLNKNKLKKFLNGSYDPELGWVRKPFESEVNYFRNGKKSFSINSIGSRINPDHENLPANIVSYGDSYTFCREVNNNETWQYYLANLQNCNVSNFGVGNYGTDQALLLFKRKIKNNQKAKYVILGVVPETIQRNLSSWKHYSEYGNTFNFKPRFILEKDKLQLIKNFADEKQKFYNLKKIIPNVSKYDYFYNDFKKNIISFPYLYNIIKQNKTKIIVLSSITYFAEKIGFNWRKIRFIKTGKVKEEIYNLLHKRINLYNNKKAIRLLLEIIKEFDRTAKANNLIPIFMLMPQSDDLKFAIKNNKAYYENFLCQVEKITNNINLLDTFIQLKDPMSIFSQKKHTNNHITFSGHYNLSGNKIVAQELNRFINEYNNDCPNITKKRSQ